MAAHTAAQKEFIVRALAAFVSPRDIIAAFTARWSDTRCSNADVDAVDPRFVTLEPDLYALFYAERERVLDDPKSAPYADQKARLIALSQDVAFLRSNGREAEARAVMRQIAEEQGAVGGKGAKPIALGGEEIAEIRETIVDPKERDAADPESSSAEGIRAVPESAAV